MVALSRGNNNSEIQYYISFFIGEVIFLTGGQILLIIETKWQHYRSKDGGIIMKSKSVCFVVLFVFGLLVFFLVC